MTTPDPQAALEQVRDLLHRNEEDRLAELKTYVETPSVSREPAGVEAATRFLVERAPQWGLTATVLETDLFPAVLLKSPHVPGAPTVVIYGHYDVQPSGDVGQWDHPPFTMTEHDGKLFGRGTADNKGQHLAHIHALQAWIATTGAPPINVTMLLDGEEEVGSPNLATLVDRHRDLLECDAVLWSDGPVHESGAPSINFGVRGIVFFTVESRGANHDLHSGNWGGVAPQPAWDVVQFLATMRAPDGRILVEGLEDLVAPRSQSEQDALDALPVDQDELDHLGIARLDVPADRPYYDRLASHPTFTINGLSTYGDGSHRTAIAARAIAQCDIRLVNDMTVEHTARCLRAHAERFGQHVELVIKDGMEPSRTDLDHPFVPALVEAVRATTGEEPMIMPAMGGSLPDYVFTGILGKPSIGVPFANPDEANHGPNENLDRDRYLTSAHTAAAILAHLAAPT